MREAGRIVAHVLARMERIVVPGVTTLDLDREAEKIIRTAGAVPTFKGYVIRPGVPPYPSSICSSVNEEIVHGIPSADRVLVEGDIVGVDVGATLKSYVGDAARTYLVGECAESTKRLVEETRRALDAGIAAMKPGGRLLDVARAIQNVGREGGYGIVRDYCGHGVGRAMHEPPQVPNYVPKRASDYDLELVPGLVLALEPMFCAGTHRTETLDDDWTIVTADRKLSAHWEHTVAVTEDGAQILTIP
ncbi:MAG: type I methionyl aminopeptidase [Candidatus Handelsmanbacteria bacterium RIFCSPLOWO2_12_FULL_64_10]|uniref:Methionine aminopeptidase n=1 Tax=Handelsmanbacteria sp. (strain RIFCSPLOWO2_12_FULL_64_10) TaxID=1817868 RepID=A0A1F6C9V5_HANXR|nr:MAG: type I methionyl aminopeptidase [Candidatus Handelsmanbacteria bacterium RIFCSPLOWO2_12_FULL_64_10]